MEEDHPQAKVVHEEDQEVLTETKIIPPTLEYVYKGRCSTCSSSVETITLEIASVKKNISVVAWCPMCRKQIDSKEVPKIKE